METKRIVPNMLDLGDPPSNPAISGDRPLDIIFVGRLVPRKGAAMLLDAIARLESRRPAVGIIGDGPLRPKLERQVRRTGLSGNVVFLGAIDDRRKTALLSKAKIACFPSLFGESFGVVILEALAAGAEAVLAGDNRGYRELLGDVGGLVDPKRTELFAAELKRLLADPEARTALGRSQRRLLPRFDAELVVDQVLDVYRDALRRRPGRSSDSSGRTFDLAA